MPVRLSSLESTYSPSMPVADVQTAVDAFAKANPRAPKIEVVNEPTTTENGRGVRGQYVDGKLTINAAYAGDAATVAEIANHEWAHATLDSRRDVPPLPLSRCGRSRPARFTDLKSRYAQQEGEIRVRTIETGSLKSQQHRKRRKKSLPLAAEPRQSSGG